MTRITVASAMMMTMMGKYCNQSPFFLVLTNNLIRMLTAVPLAVMSTRMLLEPWLTMKTNHPLFHRFLIQWTFDRFCRSTNTTGVSNMKKKKEQEE